MTVTAAVICALTATAATGDQPAAPPPATARAFTLTAGTTGPVLTAAHTSGFSMLAVTEPAGRPPAPGGYRVRTRSRASGSWSGWTVLEPGEPWWAGPSTGVEVRAADADAALAPGLRLDLADPGPGPSARPRSAAPAFGPVRAAYEGAGALPRRPRVVPRADWGAARDDGSPVVYGREVKAVFVHHTAQTNAYDCADSPAIVRGLQTLHERVNGWKDLGYNYVVDKCGTVFEGRAGGSDRPVTGAHTLGFNTDTLGVAVIGLYTDEEAPPAAAEAVARLAGWALRRYGHDPSGTVTLTSSVDNGRLRRGERVTVERVSGHRDVFATECPGTALYRQLPALRRLAADPFGGLLPGIGELPA
ncbi:N-acetylmuramoyl-L-alanine amidase [Streptomyces sp. Ag109_G2-6]|uniref:N-acetylmuramoyl-L-alanine amidase n=1 Tax=Streptomyces TaxID=1883 RepID=UPI0009A5339C|nr:MULTISPECIES: N-acetylmuramoyl-L-alanine amidase [Streptomyces]RPF43948.1 N-acetylmuramoyl-L-alanine amidase [Streptomyces sp. Ag109_G2-6]